MKKTFGAAVVSGLVALSAVSVEAAIPSEPADAMANQIVVVNESTTPVRVYVEDSEGHLYELGNLERGEAKTFETPADVLERGHFRVRVQPRHYAQRFTDPVSITTRPLTIEKDETVILWLERKLSQSKVELRAG